MLGGAGLGICVGGVGSRRSNWNEHLGHRTSTVWVAVDVAAAVPGLIDYFSIDEAAMRRIANFHLIRLLRASWFLPLQSLDAFCPFPAPAVPL